jgi:hypothetical protein
VLTIVEILAKTLSMLMVLWETFKNSKNSSALRDAYMDVGSRWKNAPAFSTLTTSMWLGNAGAIAEKVRMRVLKLIAYSPLPEGGGFLHLLFC